MPSISLPYLAANSARIFLRMVRVRHSCTLCVVGAWRRGEGGGKERVCIFFHVCACVCGSVGVWKCVLIFLCGSTHTHYIRFCTDSPCVNFLAPVWGVCGSVCVCVGEGG